MPELPEVETVRNGLAPVMEGDVITRVEQRRPDLRFPFPDDFRTRLEGQTVATLGRRAKYLLADLASGDVLVMHLGMSGSFRVEEDAASETPGDFHHPKTKNTKHDHVVLHFSNGKRIVYNDPRRFGFMTLIPRATLDAHAMFSKLGIEPLGNRLDGTFLSSAFANKKTPLKAALLDQGIIAGLGNIYVCEALWRAGLSPKRAAGTLTRKDGRPTARAETLAQVIRDVLNDAIKAGGSTLRDHAQTDGSLGYFQHTFAVYDQEHEPCHRDGCRGIIERMTQSGRSTFHCPQCQH